MASVHVLESHQNITDQPSRRIKKSGGQSLVRHGRAEWIVENVKLRMFPEGVIRMSPAVIRPAQLSSYIPASMPPVEIPGLKFDDPVKAMQSVRRFHIVVANGLGGECAAMNEI
jgi:hypothetical protein